MVEGTVSVGMTGNRVEEGERGGGYLRVLSSPSLPFCKLLHWRERVVRLCDVLLKSPAVGLLGLRIFELPAVGLPKFSKQLLGRERAELFGKR
jgi:hypothetical protein